MLPEIFEKWCDRRGMLSRQDSPDGPRATLTDIVAAYDAERGPTVKELVEALKALNVPDHLIVLCSDGSGNVLSRDGINFQAKRKCYWDTAEESVTAILAAKPKPTLLEYLDLLWSGCMDDTAMEHAYNRLRNALLAAQAAEENPENPC
jgi:hypothetical protein